METELNEWDGEGATKKTVCLNAKRSSEQTPKKGSSEIWTWKIDKS